ncbi:MAG: hypothetical protein EXR62_06795 [Chloroflexi bacterium]|nr:hypothetical protein [Chloroflexota bacterium]
MSSALPNKVNTAPGTLSHTVTPPAGLPLADGAELELFARQFFHFIGAEIAEQGDGRWLVALPSRYLPAFNGRSSLLIAFRREQKIDDDPRYSAPGTPGTELLTFGSFLLEQIMEVIRSWDTVAQGQLPAQVSREGAHDQIRSAYRFLNTSPQWGDAQAEERFYVLFNLHLELRTDERAERLVPVIVDLVTGAAQAVDQRWQTILRAVLPVADPGAANPGQHSGAGYYGDQGSHTTPLASGQDNGTVPPTPDFGNQGFHTAFAAARQVAMESLRPLIEQYEAEAQQRLQREWERLNAYYNELEMELLKTSAASTLARPSLSTPQRPYAAQSSANTTGGASPPATEDEEEALAGKHAYLLRERQLALGAEQDRHRLRITIRLVNALLVQMPVMVTQVVLHAAGADQAHISAPEQILPPAQSSSPAVHSENSTTVGEYPREPSPAVTGLPLTLSLLFDLYRGEPQPVTCASCSQPGHALWLCRTGNHIVCAVCGGTCSHCHRDSCTACGLAACSVDGQPVCRDCAATCASCHRPVCPEHRRFCSVCGESVCQQASCTARCVICRQSLCAKHQVACSICQHSGAIGPGTEAPGVGVVCPQHASTCALGQHLVCVEHSSACPICGQVHCAQHGATCGFCGQLYCRRCVAGRYPAEDGVCQTCASLVAIPPDNPYVLAARADPAIAPLLKGLALWRGGTNARYAVLEGRRTLQAEVVVLQLPSQQVCFWRSTHILERVGLRSPTAPEMPRQISRLVALQEICTLVPLTLSASRLTSAADAKSSSVDTIPDDAPYFTLELEFTNLFRHRVHTHQLSIGYYAPGADGRGAPSYSSRETLSFKVNQDAIRIRLEQRQPTIQAGDPPGMWKVSVWISAPPAADRLSPSQISFAQDADTPDRVLVPVASTPVTRMQQEILLGERIFRLGRRPADPRSAPTRR